MMAPETLLMRHVEMDPCSGNATIGYVRLNVKNGQKRMWEWPRTRHEELGGRPYVKGVGLGNGVYFLRRCWDGEEEAYLVTVRSLDRRKGVVGLEFR
jgi:hypothetical protein